MNNILKIYLNVDEQCRRYPSGFDNKRLWTNGEVKLQKAITHFAKQLNV